MCTIYGIPYTVQIIIGFAVSVYVTERIYNPVYVRSVNRDGDYRIDPPGIHYC